MTLDQQIEQWKKQIEEGKPEPASLQFVRMLIGDHGVQRQALARLRIENNGLHEKIKEMSDLLGQQHKKMEATYSAKTANALEKIADIVDARWGK